MLTDQIQGGRKKVGLGVGVGAKVKDTQNTHDTNRKLFTSSIKKVLNKTFSEQHEVLFICNVKCHVNKRSTNLVVIH